MPIFFFGGFAAYKFNNTFRKGKKKERGNFFFSVKKHTVLPYSQLVQDINAQAYASKKWMPLKSQGRCILGYGVGVFICRFILPHGTPWAACHLSIWLGIMWVAWVGMGW